MGQSHCNLSQQTVLYFFKKLIIAKTTIVLQGYSIVCFFFFLSSGGGTYGISDPKIKHDPFGVLGCTIARPNT